MKVLGVFLMGFCFASATSAESEAVGLWIVGIFVAWLFAMLEEIK